MPLGTLGKLQGAKLHHAIGLGTVCDIYAFVNGKTGHLTQLVVRMGADGANPIGAKGHPLGLLMVDRFKFLDTFHRVSLLCVFENNLLYQIFSNFARVHILSKKRTACWAVPFY